MTKTFGITKTGYSAGLYGCSAEYFTCVFTDNKGMHSFMFYGLYGAGERVEHMLEEAGYKKYYIRSNYGKLPHREGTHYAYSEYAVEKNIKELIKHGYIQE